MKLITVILLANRARWEHFPLKGGPIVKHVLVDGVHIRPEQHQAIVMPVRGHRAQVINHISIRMEVLFANGVQRESTTMILVNCARMFPQIQYHGQGPHFTLRVLRVQILLTDKIATLAVLASLIQHRRIRVIIVQRIM